MAEQKTDTGELLAEIAESVADTGARVAKMEEAVEKLSSIAVAHEATIQALNTAPPVLVEGDDVSTPPLREGERQYFAPQARRLHVVFATEWREVVPGHPPITHRMTSAQFENGVYRTSDPEMIELLEASPSFEVDFYRDDFARPLPGPHVVEGVLGTRPVARPNVPTQIRAPIPG